MFPDRKTTEVTYRLTGAWGQLFNDVLAYARELVERAEGQGPARAAHELVGRPGAVCAASRRRQPLPSTRCAHALTVRSRGWPEASSRLEDIDQRGEERVFDGRMMHCPPTTSNPPPRLKIAPTCENSSPRRTRWRVPATTPSWPSCKSISQSLLKDGFLPVVFCRYIATAHYLAEFLRGSFKTSPSRPSPAK
jgi:hypothetical protein